MELPKKVLDAKEKGDVLALTGEDENKYYFKKPTKQDINRYLATAAKGKVATAVNNLVSELAVYPNAAELKDQLADKPGKMVALNNALQNAIGMNEEFEVKKL